MACRHRRAASVLHAARRARRPPESCASRTTGDEQPARRVAREAQVNVGVLHDPAVDELGVQVRSIQQRLDGAERDQSLILMSRQDVGPCVTFTRARSDTSPRRVRRARAACTAPWSPATRASGAQSSREVRSPAHGPAAAELRPAPAVIARMRPLQGPGADRAPGPGRQDPSPQSKQDRSCARGKPAGARADGIARRVVAREPPRRNPRLSVPAEPPTGGASTARRSTRPPGRKRLGALSRSPDHKQVREDRNQRALVEERIEQHAVDRRGDFEGRLVGLDLRDHVARGDLRRPCASPTG